MSRSGGSSILTINSRSWIAIRISFGYFDNAHRSEKSPAGSAEYEYSKQRANGKPTTTNPQNLTYLINLILLPVRVVTVMVVLLSVKLNRTTTMHTICKHNALFSLCVSHGTGALLSTKTTTTHSDTRKCSTVCLPWMRLTCPCVSTWAMFSLR